MVGGSQARRVCVAVLADGAGVLCRTGLPTRCNSRAKAGPCAVANALPARSPVGNGARKGFSSSAPPPPRAEPKQCWPACAGTQLARRISQGVCSPWFWGFSAKGAAVSCSNCGRAYSRTRVRRVCQFPSGRDPAVAVLLDSRDGFATPHRRAAGDGIAVALQKTAASALRFSSAPARSAQTSSSLGSGAGSGGWACGEDRTAGLGEAAAVGRCPDPALGWTCDLFRC